MPYLFSPSGQVWRSLNSVFSFVETCSSGMSGNTFPIPAGATLSGVQETSTLLHRGLQEQVGTDCPPRESLAHEPQVSARHLAKHGLGKSELDPPPAPSVKTFPQTEHIAALAFTIVSNALFAVDLFHVCVSCGVVIGPLFLSRFEWMSP